MKRFVISHSWSYNMGDAAMLRTLVGILRQINPDCEITALVSDPEYTRVRCRGLRAGIDGWVWPVRYGSKPGFFDLSFRYPAIFFGNMLSAAAYRIFKRGFFLFNRRHSTSITRLMECDAFICPGGDFISPGYFYFSTFAEIAMARMLGKRIVICAQTIGPFKGAFASRLAGAVLGMADLIIAREERTARHLRELGLRDVHVAADLAFTFPLPPKRGNGKRKRQVVICPKKVSRNLKGYAQGIRLLCSRISSSGYGIVCLPSDRYDADFHAEILSGFGKNVTLVGEVHPPERIARIISESEFIVSGRMHAIILGTLSNTPFFAIGDGFKFREMLGPLCDDCTIRVDELDANGVERIVRAIGEAELRRAQIGKRMIPIIRKSKMNADILRAKMTEWGLAGE